MKNKDLLLNRIRELSPPMEPQITAIHSNPATISDIDTVLFDIYGTLLISGSGDVGTATQATDSTEALIQSLIVSGFSGDCERAGELGPELLKTEIERWHNAARQTGIEFPEVEIFRVWKNITETLQRLELLKPDEDMDKIRRLAIEYECRVNPVWLMPGALETIDALRSRGIRLGIVSNAQFYTPLILEALFGNPVEEMGFDPELCVWSYQVLHAKPSIELFRMLETDLHKTLYVGNDMLNDIWTATQAGCRTVLFAGDQRSLRLREQDSRCARLTPSATINDLRQIPEIIE